MRVNGMRTLATLEISAEAYAEIRAKLKAAEYVHAIDRVDGVEVIDMHGIGLLASAPVAGAVERHLVQIRFGANKWLDVCMCDTPKEVADFLLTLGGGLGAPEGVTVRAVHLKSYASAEELA